MKYSEVLYNFHPIETGDFMLRYNINNRGYIIYSPKLHEISCLELSDFRDITPSELFILIQQPKKIVVEGIKEFGFKHSCEKEKLLMYLFDVARESNCGLKIKHVSDQEEYFLYDITGSHRIRNIYQFNPLTKESQLLFDNKDCYAVLFEEEQSERINVCWDPVLFNHLEQQEEKNPSYLLPSSNPILCSYIDNVINVRSAKVDLYVGEHSLEALMFLDSYLESKGEKKRVSVSTNECNVVVRMIGWQPISLIKFISEIQKDYIERIRKIYRIKTELNHVSSFHLKSVCGHSFITFGKNNIEVDTFLRNILEWINLNKISYRE